MLKTLFILLFITDLSNEPLTGVKIELVGTNKVYYTNIKGQVLVPSDFDLKLDYISYKTKTINKDSVKQHITLISR
jgi:RNase P/RNase MRP subunit p29